jgi:replicative DNA helicase
MTTTTSPTATTTTVPPHNLEAERSVLGAVLLTPVWLTRITLDVGLTGEDFYRPWHGQVFTAMCTLEQAGEPIDHLTVAEVMRGCGQLGDDLEPTAVEQLLSWVPTAAHGVQYAQIVRDHAQLRRLLAATYEIQAMVAERGDSAAQLIDAAEQQIFKLRGDALRATRRRLEDAVDEEIDRLQQAASDGREIPGVETGLPQLDRLLGGLQDGRLYVVAARPSMGKSLFSLQIARHVARSRAGPVLFASLEMSDAETAQRHLAAESGVDPDLIHLGQVAGADWPALLQAAAGTVGMPLHLIDDGDLSLSKLRAQARQLAVRDDGLGLVVVDYLQLMRVERPTGSRVEDVSEFSRGLKRLARELRCPVLAVSQLSRAVEQRPDKRPLLSDLRESGQIEADADCVLMLYREDYYDPDSDRQGEMDIIVRKNRQGGLGQITCARDEHLRFAVSDHDHATVERVDRTRRWPAAGGRNGNYGAAR